MSSELADGLRDAVDGLLAAPVAALDGAELAALVAAVEVQKRRLDAVDHLLLAAVAERGIAGDYGATSPADLLVRLVRVTPGEAAARVAQARDCGPRRELTGPALPPILPATAAAVAAGEVSSGHVSVISRVLDRVPADIAVEAAPVIEAVLVEAARHEHPRQLARTGEVLLARLDPDGRAPLDEEAWRRRDVTVTPFADGSAAVRGRLTPQTSEVLRTILDALSAPTPAQDGVPDVRSAGQRRHDALHEVLMHALRSGEVGAGPRDRPGGEPPGSAASSGGSPVCGGDARSGERSGCEAAGSGSDVSASQASGAGSGVPSTGLVPAIAPKAAAGADASPGGGRGVPVTVLATVTLAELRAGSGIVTTGHGDVWSVSQLLALAGDMAVAPVVLDHRGAVLAFGRTRRLASRAQRLALAARDRGCAFVGCDRPAAWCEAHHVVEWSDGGPTDIDNLCLLCTYHHAHFRAAGWRVIMQDGLPYCVPPRWLDPDQRPVRNTAHRPSEIDLRAPPSRGSP